jgi:IS6 family transposase
MPDPARFNWRHCEADIILCAVRGYRRYALSYRAGEELLRARGVWVDHTTVCRGGQRSAPELDQRGRPQLQATKDSYRVDETSSQINKPWYDLDRAVDATGATLEFRVSATRDADAAERFFRKVLRDSPTLTPRVSTVAKNAASPPAVDALQQDSTLPETCRLRPCTYWHTRIEPEQRLVTRLVNPGLGLGAFHTAPRTIQGDEALHRLRKGQIEGIATGAVLAQNRVINQIFGLAA